MKTKYCGITKVQNAGKRNAAWFTGLLTAENLVNEFGYRKAIEIIEDITIRKSNQFSYGLLDYLESEAFQILKSKQLKLIENFEFAHTP